MTLLEKYQKQIIKAAEEFAKGEFDLETALSYDKNPTFPTDIIKKAGELGFLGIHIDESYGGGNLSYFESVLVGEKLASIDSTFALSIIYSQLGAEAIFLFGTEEQKKDLLPQLLVGEKFISSNLGSIYSLLLGEKQIDKLNVTKKENGFEIQGEIRNIPYASYANHLILAIDRYLLDQKSGVGLFVLSMENNIKIIPESKGLGWNMIPRYKVKLEGTIVNEENFVGKGLFSISDLKRYIISEAIMLASIGIGIGSASIKKGVEHIKLREQFRKKLMEFPAIRDKVSDMILKLNSTRYLTYEASKIISNQKKGLKSKKIDKLLNLALCAKYMSAQLAKEIADHAIQLLGGYGYMREYHVERYYRDAKCLELYGGDKYKLRELIFQTGV